MTQGDGSDLYNSHQRWEYNAAGQASSVSVLQAGSQEGGLAYRGPGQGQLIRDGSYTVGHNLLGVASRERTATAAEDTTHRSASAAEQCPGATAGGRSATGERSSAATEPSYYARATDGTLVSQRNLSARRNYLYNGEGTVVGLTDQAGALRTDYTYEPYGHPANLTSLGDENPFGYLGTYTAGAEDQGVLSGGPSQIGGAFYDAEDGRFTQLAFDPVNSAQIDLGAGPFTFGYGENDDGSGFTTGGFQIPFIDGAPERLKLGFGISGKASTGTYDGGGTGSRVASWLA